MPVYKSPITGGGGRDTCAGKGGFTFGDAVGCFRFLPHNFSPMSALDLVLEEPSTLYRNLPPLLLARIHEF